MKKIIASMISSVIILSAMTVNVFADETQITKNSDGTITQKVYDDSVKNKLEFDGKIYKIKNKIEKTQEEREKKTLTQTKVFENLEEKQVPDILEFEYNGEKFTLNLSDVQYTEKEIENGTINLTGTIDYGFLTERPEVAPTKEVSYKDNGIDKTATIPYSNLDKSNEYWKSGFTINGRYIGDDDTMYFNFNGNLIPNTNDGSVPYVNYENTILNSLGINPNLAKIDSANWTNIFTEQGQQVKECVFNLSYYGADYVANYSDTITGHKTVYEANATYTLENADVKTGQVKEYIEATYKLNTLNPLLLTTSTAVILALIIVLILFILKKRKKQSDKK